MKPEKSFTVAFISDLHIDSFIKPDSNGEKLQSESELFIHLIMEIKPADILILAGDIGHYMRQNALLLQILAEERIYKKIFVVAGNHDQYLVSNAQLYEYQTSNKKVEHLKKVCESIETVEFLDGNVVEIDGIKIGGIAGGCDFSYGYKQFGLTKLQMLLKWRDSLNDANYIKGDDIIPELVDSRASMVGAWGRIKNYSFDPLKYFESEKEKLEKNN